MAAKKQDAKPAAAKAEAAPAGNNKKMMIIFGAALVVAIAASVGGTLFLLGPSEEAAAEPAEPVYTEALYFTFTPAFVVNYVVANKPRFLQTELALLARNPAVIDAMTAHAPMMRARVLDKLSAQNFGDLQSQAGKEALQAALLETVNTALTEQKIDAQAEQILFSSFVLQ